ncbi:ABC transporter ATP-binding protein [Neobacillus cucumis]|uniref:ABC transporter ATP-binding protein n=1 Tax=Neobacillus cucumis TaxID=1740721 RepID=UPI001964C919|nr:ABC transporter ATP-binding protein [Neobacillus cucumis]MBM7651870.1 ATP-binding cassette subfamily C protein [Neobacillus cucumis]
MRHIWHFAKSIHSFAGKTLYLNLVGMIFISLIEGIGIFLLVPLISLTGIFDVQIETISILTWIQSILKKLPNAVSLLIILTSYVLLITGQSFLQQNQSILNTKIQHGYLRHLREETYTAIIRSNWGFFLKKRKSDIVNLLITDIARVSGGTLMFLQFLASLVFTMIQIGISFWLSAQMTVTILILGFALIFFSKRFVNRSGKIGAETVELGKVYLAGITDHFNGIKDIKSNTLEESHIEWISVLGLKLEKNVVEMVRLNTISQFIFKVVSAILMAGFIFYSIKMFRAQPAELMLIIAIFTRLWPRFSGIQSNLEQIGAIVPSFKTLIELQNDCLESQETYIKSYKNLDSMNLEMGLECKDIFFRYELTKPTFALQDINIYIPAKQMTAIVGRSGAGKSTLIDLLMGLNGPGHGQVLIDGIPLSQENLMSFRQSISYVPQDPFLFNTTVRDNLLMMKPSASEEQLWESLEFSSAAEFVRKLPQGLDTLIGDRGIRLSGGERQRLVLARAILRKPSILFLDEATSALDTENEAKIQEAIERLKGKMTVIVIAHRLSTIRNADQVIVLDQGCVIQQGEFSQLESEKKGMFSNLLKKQMGISVGQ